LLTILDAAKILHKKILKKAKEKTSSGLHDHLKYDFEKSVQNFLLYLTQILV